MPVQQRSHWKKSVSCIIVVYEAEGEVASKAKQTVIASATKQSRKTGKEAPAFK
jgi:hypothetical protein